MEINKKLFKKMVLIGIAVVSWVALFLWLGRTTGTRDFWAMMLIGAAAITFFGFLGLPGNIDDKGAFRESRIRLSITGTLLIVYLIYFGSIVYLQPDTDAEGNIIKTEAESLLPTLTNLLMVTIPFYFGSSVAVEIANLQSKKGDSKAKE